MHQIGGHLQQYLLPRFPHRQSKVKEVTEYIDSELVTKTLGSDSESVFSFEVPLLKIELIAPGLR
jgi:hypothetical protein